MLKILRNKKTAKKVWILLAIIIIPAFTLWGFGSSSRDREMNKPAGKIFGKNVSNQDFQNALSAAKTAAIMRFGDEFPKVEKYLNLESQAWERLIMLEEARRRKISIDDREVIITIQKAPYFQKNSAFDNKTYVEILRYVFRLQPRAFEEQMRQNLILAKLYQQVTEGVKIDETRVRQEWLKANEELSIDYIAALFSDFAKKINPSDKDISAYYEKNKEGFREPMDLNLEYLSFEPEETAKKTGELTAKKYGLDAIAKELKLDKKETGLFKQFATPPSLKIPQGTINTVINLKPGEPAPAVKIEGVYYVFSLKEKTPGRLPELAEMKERIKGILIRDRAREAARDKIDACAEELKKNKTFEQAARSVKLKVKETKFFKSTDKIDELGQAKLFWDKARNLKPEETSGPFSDGNGCYILKLKTVKSVDEEQFAKDKPGLTENMLEQEKNKVFNKFIEETKKKAEK